MTEPCSCTEAEVVRGCRTHDARTKGPISPDCRDGNHAKCPGDAWDLVLDLAVDCYCFQCVHAGRCNHPAPFLVGQGRACVREAGHGGPCHYPAYFRATP
jgi:hypothetical protein